MCRKDIQLQHATIVYIMTITQKSPITTTNPDNWLLEIIKKVNQNAAEQQVITRANNSLCVSAKAQDSYVAKHAAQ